MGEGGIARRIKANSELVLMRNIYNVATDDGTESFQPSQLKLFMIELVQLNCLGSPCATVVLEIYSCGYCGFICGQLTAHLAAD